MPLGWPSTVTVTPPSRAAAQPPAVVVDADAQRLQRADEPDDLAAGVHDQRRRGHAQARRGPARPPAKATHTSASPKPWAWPHHHDAGKPPLDQFFSA